MPSKERTAESRASGWKRMTEEYPWFSGEGSFPLPAYSEFMPPPRLGVKPSGEVDPDLFPPDDPYGWKITEWEQETELEPGLAHLAAEIGEHLVNLGQGKPEHHITGHHGENLMDNPYWPPELAQRAGQLPHERYVLLLPLALSRTQDDQGRVRWTFFGASEQGPERAFWQSFYEAPGKEAPASDALRFLGRLLNRYYGEDASDPDRLHALGFRILPAPANPEFPHWHVDALPGWTGPLLLKEEEPPDRVRYLLTFQPFEQLPQALRENYIAGKLALLPFPGSLVYWGAPTYHHLQHRFPYGTQISLLRMVGRNEGPEGIRVPQSGWFHIPRDDKPRTVQAALVRDEFARTNRWDRAHKYDDRLTQNPRLDKVVRVLFSSSLEVLGLYDKPMARNSQIWTDDFDPILDGPPAARADLDRARAALEAGGLFAYRFFYPPMRAGAFEVFWHRPLVAGLGSSGKLETLPGAPTGYLTAYPAGAPDLAHPVELWPRLLRRPHYLAALRGFDPAHDLYRMQTPQNVTALLEAAHDSGDRPLPRGFARSLIRTAKDDSLDRWLDELTEHARDAAAAGQAQAAVKEILASEETPPEPITFSETATRAFEEAWWRDIVSLAHGQYKNKDNADVVQDPVTRGQAPHLHRDLHELGEHLLKRYREMIAAEGMEGQAVCGELPFRWQTDFDFPEFGGWKANQEGRTLERNLLVVIPGKNRREAVVMADHYDTAYMEDVFEKEKGGSGARLSAAGADDNYSATATLLRAAPIFLKLAKEGKLARDVWLLHLTGEEFPADCLGARFFCQAYLEKRLKLHVEGDKWLDFSDVRLAGVYVSDMIGHNRDDDRDTFQISPGVSRQSLWLAYQAHLATAAWNAHAPEWNRSPERPGRGRSKRSADPQVIPAIADVPRLHGEVRVPGNPHSSLYNTDGQIFSDAGLPVVLFMENYDINRTGYHDTHDTMENIDLDYGAAVASIVIETVARVATAATTGFPKKD